MSVYFPPDVRVRIDGEPSDARPYLGRARDVLFKALNMQAAGQALPIKLTQRLDDNAYAQVLLTGNQKIVFISAGPAIPEVVELPPEEIIPEVPPEVFFDMLSGWVAPGNITTGTNTDTGATFKQLEQYKPTHDTAIEYHFKELYAKIKRLAVPGLAPVVLNPSPALFQGSALKSSMYSGSMKEIIQALMGLGIITDDSRSYIDGTLPVPMKRPIQVKYDYKSGRTHGVVKAGDKNWWLVEISVTNGIIAMPLPLLTTTTTKAYHSKLKARKAVESLAVVDKYGGLPSGEVFPSGTALADAITAGKVIRLMNPSDLDPYYTKNIYASQIGWAFAETDQKADNTCWELDDTTGVKVGYHYGIDFVLSPWDLSQLALSNPVGTGTATLVVREQGYLNGPSELSVEEFGFTVVPPIRIYDEASDFMDLFLFDVQSGKSGVGQTSDTPLFVFYRGNEREVLRYFYPVASTAQTVTDHLSTGTRFVNAQFYGTSIDKREWSYNFSAVYYDNSILSPHFSTLGIFDDGSNTSTMYLRRTDNDKLQRIARSQIGGAAIVKFMREGYVINSYKRDGGFQRNYGVFIEPAFEAVNNTTGAGVANGTGIFAINGVSGVTPPFWDNLTAAQVSTNSFETFEYFAVVGNYGVLTGNSLREDNIQDRHAGGDAYGSNGPISGTSPTAIFLAQTTYSYTQVAPPSGGYPPEAAWNKFRDNQVIVTMSADFNAGPTKGILLEGRAVPSTDTADIVLDFVRRGPNLDGFTPADMSWIGRV